MKRPILLPGNNITRSLGKYDLKIYLSKTNGRKLDNTRAAETIATEHFNQKSVLTKTNNSVGCHGYETELPNDVYANVRSKLTRFTLQIKIHMEPQSTNIKNHLTKGVPRFWSYSFFYAEHFALTFHPTAS